MDLSKIDFEALRSRFKESKHRNTDLEVLNRQAQAYTEDQFVKQSAIGLLGELGWSTVSALEETFGATGTLLRETKGEVVLVSRLRADWECLRTATIFEALSHGHPAHRARGRV